MRLLVDVSMEVIKRVQTREKVNSTFVNVELSRSATHSCECDCATPNGLGGSLHLVTIHSKANDVSNNMLSMPTNRSLYNDATYVWG
jgi:hypothetical protein